MASASNAASEFRCPGCGSREFSTASNLRRHWDVSGHRRVTVVEGTVALSTPVGTSFAAAPRLPPPISRFVVEPPAGGVIVAALPPRSLSSVSADTPVEIIAEQYRPPMVTVSSGTACFQFHIDAFVEASELALDIIDAGGSNIAPAVALLNARTPGSLVEMCLAALEGVVVGSASRLRRLRAAREAADRGPRPPLGDEDFSSAVAEVLSPLTPGAATVGQGVPTSSSARGAASVGHVACASLDDVLYEDEHSVLTPVVSESFDSPGAATVGREVWMSDAVPPSMADGLDVMNNVPEGISLSRLSPVMAGSIYLDYFEDLYNVPDDF